MGQVSSVAAVKMKLKTNSKNKENSADHHSLRTSTKWEYYFWDKIRNVYGVDEHKNPQHCV